MNCAIAKRLSGVTLVFCVVGCAAQSKPTTVTAAAVISAPPLAPASPGKTNSTIYLSERMREACGITTVANIKDTPKFAFDQSAILPEDRDVLAVVAQCLTSGALRGNSVRLVGRADPRGTAEYNMALGERRSNSVMTYLAGLGVSAPRMSETSRGALDASGSTESAWQQDRRVDIDLAL
jgi:peptidoglycan-associated lipoprotein